MNDGTGTFNDVTAERMPVDTENTVSLAVGDVDLDGDLDLVFSNWRQDRLYLNDGAGTFSDTTMPRMPIGFSEFGAIALGDVDQDGDLDLVSGESHWNHLYFNVARQLDAPFLLRVGHDFQLDVYARYGLPRLVDLALPFVSTGRASIPLPPLGTVGVDPTTLIPLPPLLVPAPSGLGSLTFRVPNYPSLAGAPIFAQALLVQYPVQSRLTNVTGDVIWR